MYMTIEETADYLGMPVSQVQKYVLEGRIRGIHNGNEFLVNQAQFALYFKQLETVKRQIAEYLSEQIPPDRDIKDED